MEDKVADRWMRLAIAAGILVLVAIVVAFVGPEKYRSPTLCIAAALDLVALVANMVESWSHRGSSYKKRS